MRHHFEGGEEVCYIVRKRFDSPFVLSKLRRQLVAWNESRWYLLRGQLLDETPRHRSKRYRFRVVRLSVFGISPNRL